MKQSWRDTERECLVYFYFNIFYVYSTCFCFPLHCALNAFCSLCKARWITIVFEFTIKLPALQTVIWSGNHVSNTVGLYCYIGLHIIYKCTIISSCGCITLKHYWAQESVVIWVSVLSFLFTRKNTYLLWKGFCCSYNENKPLSEEVMFLTRCDIGPVTLVTNQQQKPTQSLWSSESRRQHGRAR